ncbi:MAG: cytochrome P450 [Acidimicrobiia bacterium]
MPQFEELDFFTDPSLVEDPYPWFAQVQAECPVWKEPHYGVVAVSGWDLLDSVYRQPTVFSSINSPIGPFPPLPFTPEGDDITEMVREHRKEFPLYEHLVTMDPPDHTKHRTLLMRLFSPKRLDANEDFMWTLADRQMDTFLADGRCEFIRGYSQPFAALVIADLLGVPEADHKVFLKTLTHTPGEVGVTEGSMSINPLEFLDNWFNEYVADRRANPRDDVLTELATAKFADGSTPEVQDVVRIATFLFAAGQETTARVLATIVMLLAEHPDLQEQVRADRSLIPALVEESLRLESPVKADFRLALRSTELGGMAIPAGTCVMLMNGAANRDPSHFEAPDEMRLDRYNLREHMAFGRGVHSCPGGPLARVEARVSLERILDRMHDIRIDESVHGPADDRHFSWEPTYILRGLTALNITFTPAG